jgi:hypothetical protein
MAYKLHIDNEGILQVKISEDFTEDELKLYMLEIDGILMDIQDGEKLKTFIDTTDLGRVNPNLRRSVGDFMDTPKFGHTAVLGNSRVVKVMIDFTLKASGRHHMRYFTDREEATAWLHNSD